MSAHVNKLFPKYDCVIQAFHGNEAEVESQHWSL